MNSTRQTAGPSPEIGGFAATLALMQIQNGLARDRLPHHQLCASFDIQYEDVHIAPRNYAAKAKELENGCRFIAAMWHTVWLGRLERRCSREEVMARGAEVNGA